MLRKIQEKHPAIGVDHRVELWLIPIFIFFYYLFTMSLFSMHSVLLYEDIFRVFSFIPNFQRFFIISVSFIFILTNFK